MSIISLILIYFSIFSLSYILIKNIKVNFILILISVFLIVDFSIFLINNININGSFSRVVSIIGDRTYASDVMSAIALFLISVFITTNTNKIYKIILFLLNLIAAIYLILLRTRTGYVAYMVGLTISWWVLYYFNSKDKLVTVFYSDSNCCPFHKCKTKNNINLELSFTILILFLAIWVSTLLPVKQQFNRNELTKTFSSIIDKDFQTNKMRLIYWNASLNMFIENPITGVGGGKWSGIFPKYRGEIFNDENIDINSSVYAHNDYLELLAEFGIIGIFYLLFIISGIYKLIIKSMKDLYYLPFLSVAISFWVTSLFNFTKENLVAMIFFMATLGIGYAGSIELKITNYEFINKNKLLLNKILVVSCILFLILGVGFKVMSIVK